MFGPCAAASWLSNKARALGVASAAVLLAAQVAGAGEPYQYELSSGIETTSNASSAHASLTFAPNSGLNRDGLRLRLAAGGGRYDYFALLHAGGGAFERSVEGRHGFADALLGYQWSIGELTVKAFAGVAWTEHLLSPSDPANQLAGETFGAKGAIEAWLNLSPVSWASVDLSAMTNNRDVAGRFRYGYRLYSGLSVGPEVGGYSTNDYTVGRVGAFLRYDWRSGEVSLSGGVSGDIEEPSTPYASLNVAQKF